MGLRLDTLVEIATSLGVGALLARALDAFITRRKRISEARADDVQTDGDAIRNLQTVIEEQDRRYTELSARFEDMFKTLARLQQDYLITKQHASSLEIEVQRMRDEGEALRCERAELLETVSDLAARVAQLEVAAREATDDAARLRVLLTSNGIDPATGKRTRGGL